MQKHMIMHAAKHIYIIKIIGYVFKTINWLLLAAHIAFPIVCAAFGKAVALYYCLLSFVLLACFIALLCLLFDCY